MHSTSLIGQALGAATGTKASPAQDAPKNASERSFADFVDGTSTEPDVAAVKHSDIEADMTAEQVEAGAAASQDSPADAEKGADELSLLIPAAKETAPDGASVQFSGAERPVDAEAGQMEQAGRVEQGQVQQEAAVTKAEGRDPVSAAESDSPDIKSGEGKDLLAAVRQQTGQSTGPAGSETLKTRAPEQRLGGDSAGSPTAAAEDVKAARQVAAGADPAQSHAEVTSISAGTRPVQNGRAAAEGASVQTAQSAVAVPSAGKEAESLRKVVEAAEETRRQPGNTTANTPGIAASAAATSGVRQSVFQMRIEGEEAGEARKVRYRGRAGESQIAAEVAKASAEAAGIKPNAVASVTNSAIAMAQSLQSAAVKLSKEASLLGDSLGGGAGMASDMPGLPQLLTEAVFQSGIAHRPETPRMIAAQLAEAFAAKGDRNVDVSLNPEELGRVKMRVTTSETGITMIIQTERPETGDLMRRHINELAEEFRRMGFQDISFEFSSGGSSDGQSDEQGLGDGAGSGSGARGAGAEMAVSGEVAETQIQNLRLGTTGLDMRV